VRIGFNALDPRILPDMGIKVTFLREADAATAAAQPQPVTLVPAAAVRTDNDTKVVFVVQPAGTVERRAVQIGMTDGDRLEVKAGLKAGDRVVVSPPPDIEDGAMVVVK
jgi:HlyD family secretion protein